MTVYDVLTGYVQALHVALVNDAPTLAEERKRIIRHFVDAYIRPEFSDDDYVELDLGRSHIERLVFSIATDTVDCEIIVRETPEGYLVSAVSELERGHDTTPVEEALRRAVSKSSKS